MCIGRRAHVNHLDVSVGQQVFGLGVDAANPELARHSGRAFRNDVTNSHQFDPWIGSIARKMSLLGPRMRTEDTDAEFANCTVHQKTPVAAGRGAPMPNLP